MMDRGMASAANVAWLRATGRRYIIGRRSRNSRSSARSLPIGSGWREVHEGVEVKLCASPRPARPDPVPLGRAAQKEKAMHDKFSGRINAALGRLAARIAGSKKRLDPAQLNRQIGRLLQQN